MSAIRLAAYQTQASKGRGEKGSAHDFVCVLGVETNVLCILGALMTSMGPHIYAHYYNPVERVASVHRQA